MTQEQRNAGVPGRTRSARGLRIASIGLIVVGAVLYVRGIELAPDPLRVPLRPLVVDPQLTSAVALPAQPGSLVGQNLLLVTLDTTRPDRLGCYGSPRSATPNLDRLAGDGIVFSRAVAVGSTTLPTHASILTGLYPHRHGAGANAVFRLDDRNQTLAERLSEQGYETAAFVSSFVLDARFGLHQGFDEYDDGATASDTSFGFAERRADETTERALQWLRGPRAAPFFLWVHYYDAHNPYEPPASFEAAYENAYDAEIAFVDQQLGLLLDAVESAPGPGTLVAVTADHGEGLGEHGELTHGNLVQEATLRIPLVLRAANGLSGGIHIRTRVSQVDLAPTLLSLLVGAVPEGLDGVDLTATADPFRPVLAETIEGRVHYGWARLTALYRGSLKYVDGPNPELYDLARDPLERRNLAATGLSEQPQLARQLQTLRPDEEIDMSPSRTSLTRADIERLEALGYLVTGADVSPRAGSGPAPKQMLPLFERLQLLLSSQRRLEKLPLWMRVLDWASGGSGPSTTGALIRELEQLAEDHPGFSPVHWYLVELYQRENRPDDARRASEALKRLVGSSPQSP
jgi:choline-sulfatase